MMTSPFPGMDSFLEINSRGEVFHGWFICKLAEPSMGRARELGCEVEVERVRPGADGGIDVARRAGLIPRAAADVAFQSAYHLSHRPTLQRSHQEGQVPIRRWRHPSFKRR